MLGNVLGDERVKRMQDGWETPGVKLARPDLQESGWALLETQLPKQLLHLGKRRILGGRGDQNPPVSSMSH